MRLLGLLLLTAIVGCTSGQPKKDSYQFKVPPRLGYVSDYENSFSAEEEYRIDSTIQIVNRRGKIQIGFASFDSTFVADTLFSGYALAVARNWGIGHSEKNDGLFICVSLTMRSIQIKTGLGIDQSITDSMVKQVIDSIIIPDFKKQNFTKGLCAAIVALGEMADLTIK